LKARPLKRTAVFPFALALAAASVGVAQDRARGGPAGLTGLRRVLSAPIERRSALADSLVSAVGAFPLCTDSLAVFVHRASAGRSITVAGDFNRWNPSADTLREITGSGLYMLALPFEPDARLDYKIVVDGKDWILDPLNPRTCTGGFGPNSELAMPEYRRPPETGETPVLPRGRLDTLSFESRLMKNGRRVIVYLPASYGTDPKPAYPVLYVNDGGEYLTLGSMSRALDNLMGGGEMREIIAVFIDPLNRNAEYWLNSVYLNALASELVPLIDSRYRTDRRPCGRGIMGASLGGVTALDAVRSFPGVFGLCASQSGAFWIEDGRIVKLLNDAKPAGLRIYLDWGSYEPEIAGLNGHIADLLKSGGNAVTVRTWHEGHSWGSWRAHLGGLLSFLFPADPRAR
jgi:enterochelin esterase-like enzyme